MIVSTEHVYVYGDTRHITIYEYELYQKLHGVRFNTQIRKIFNFLYFIDFTMISSKSTTIMPGYTVPISCKHRICNRD